MQALNFAAPQGVESAAVGATMAPRGMPAETDAAEIGAFVAALLAQTMAPPGAVPGAPAGAATATDAAAGVAALPGLRQALAAAGTVPLLADGATAAAALARQEAPDGGVAAAAGGAATELEALLGELPDTRELPADAARGALRRTADDLTGLRATPPPAALAAASEVATREAGGELAARVDGADAGGVNTLQRFTDGTQLAQSFHGKSAPLPMHEPGLFAERLNQQVAVMVSQHASHARLAVNPAELGPVEVRVSVVGDEATIQLIATHAATREALEEALPRLRAAFADGGIALGDAAVFSQTPERQAGGRGEAGDAGHAARQHAGEPASEPVMQPLRTVRLGLVDAFV